MTACLLQERFEREWALNVISFCYNSKKEHDYFFYPEWKTANMSTSFRDASHTLNVKLYIGWHIPVTLLLRSRTFLQSVPKHTSRQNGWKTIWKVAQAICRIPQIMYPSAIAYNHVVACSFHWASGGLNNSSEPDVIPHVRHSYGK